MNIVKNKIKSMSFLINQRLIQVSSFILVSSLLTIPLTAQTPGEEIEAAAKAGKSIPLSMVTNLIPIPMPKSIKAFFEKIAIEKPAIKTEEGALRISGGVVFANQTLEGVIRKKGSQFSLSVGLPQGFQFSSVDPMLKPLDTLQISRGKIVLSQFAYQDPEWDREVKAGVNFLTTIKVGGPLEKLANLARVKKAELTFGGILSPQITGSSFSVQLPGEISLGPVGKTRALSLNVYLTESAPGVPSVDFAIETGFDLNIPGQKPPVGLIGEIRAKGVPLKVYLSGYMKGYYENAFGFKGLKVGEFGFGAETDIATAASTEGILTLTGIGLQGGVGLGQKTLKCAGFVDYSTTPQVLFASELEGGLKLRDVVAFALEIAKRAAAIGGKKLDVYGKIKKKIPNLGFDTLKLYIVPQAATFAGVSYEKGIKVDVTADILKTRSQITFTVNETGLNGLGYIKNFNLGPFKLTGVGPDKKEGTEDDGALIQVVLDPTKLLAEFFVDGTVEMNIFDGIKGATRIDLSPTGLSFKLQADMYKQFSALIQVDAKGSISPSARAETARTRTEAAAARKELGLGAQATTALPSAGIAQSDEEAVAATTESQDVVGQPTTEDIAEDINYGIYVKFTQEGLSKLGALCKKAAAEMKENAVKVLNEKQKEVDNLNAKQADLNKQITDAEAKDKELDAANRASVERAQNKINDISTSKRKLNEAIARCKGKKPKLEKDITEFAEGLVISQQDLDRAIDEIKRENPQLTAEQIAAIKQQSAAAVGQIAPAA